MNKCMVVFILVASSFLAYAQPSISFSVTTDRSHVMVGEQTTITARIVSTRELKTIQPPPFPQSDFYTVLRVSRDQQHATSIQIVNGKMNQSIQYTYLFYYTVALKKEGLCKIPPLQFTHDGESYSSTPFSITIGKESVEEKYISLAIRTNKSDLYVGEQGIITIVVAQKAQTPVNVTNQGFMTIIEKVQETFTQNFSINRLFTDKIAQGQQTINGQLYQTYTLSFSIIALKAGNYTLASIPFEYEELRRVRRRSNDIFDDFFGSSFFGQSMQRIPKMTYSNKLSLTVKELPPPPSGFSGAVGEFGLKAQINTDTIAAGEALTLKVTHIGTTRPGNITDIKLPPMDNFEVFTPEKHTDADTTARGITTTKIYKYLVIPRKEGKQTIPSIEWHYFDPAKNSYQVARTAPLNVTVTKGKERSSHTAPRYLTQEDIRQVGHDIRYIKTPQKLKAQTIRPYTNPLFFVLYPVPFLLAIFAVLYKTQAIRSQKDAPKRIRRYALPKALKEIQSLRKGIDASKSKETIAALADIIERYITERFGFPAAGKTIEELHEELLRHGVNHTCADSLYDVIEQLDGYRFSGITPDEKKLLEIIGTVQRTLSTFEKGKK